MNTLSSDTAVFDRAIELIDALQEGGADSADLFRWLAESPRHVEEFTYALTIQDGITGIPPTVRARLDALTAAERASPGVVALTEQPSFPRRQESLAPANRNWKLFALAACVATCAVLAGWLVWNAGRQIYATAIGEQKTVSLSDGSVIHLNTGTTVEVRYDEGARQIRLKAGEALFEVRQDPARPFVVRTDARLIQALGTAFTVYRRPTDLRVAVMEGSVRVSQEQTVIDELKAGEGVRITADGVLYPIDASQAAAWRHRRLIFRNDTLADIAREFNRYNTRPQVRIADHDAGMRRFNAAFEVNAPDELVHVLQVESGLEVVTSLEEIVVRSRH